MLKESLFYLQFFGVNEKSVLYTLFVLRHFIEVINKTCRDIPPHGRLSIMIICALRETVRAWLSPATTLIGTFAPGMDQIGSVNQVTKRNSRL